jgi:two-component system sensor histidine kinase MtrB
MASRGGWRFGLRLRVTLLFALTTLLATLVLAVVSYSTARSYLLDQRDTVARRQAFNNAQLVRTILRSSRSEAGDLIASVRTEGSGFAVLHLGPENLYYPQDLRFTQDALPASLRTQVLDGSTGTQRFTIDGEPYLAVGVSIAELDVHYFEAFSLDNVSRTLRVLTTAIAIGGTATVAFAAALGWWTSRGLLRPISRVADAAGEIAGGSLGARLTSEDDPDLARLAQSFNEMADTVQTRLEREARFASDVSHELRSPITALTAAVEVLDSRRSDLPERTRQALDVVSNQVRRFDRLVLDLLELSRLDLGAADLHLESLVLPDVAALIARHNGFAEVRIEHGPGGTAPVMVDKRRLERIVVNLLQNAEEHAGGATRLRVEPSRQSMLLMVDDAGPGVSASDKERIFERFARGTAARHRVGSGLGLALVAEHARAHGGSAWVEDVPGGGTRFVVSFPLEGRR